MGIVHESPIIKELLTEERRLWIQQVALMVDTLVEFEAELTKMLPQDEASPANVDNFV